MQKFVMRTSVAVIERWRHDDRRRDNWCRMLAYVATAACGMPVMPNDVFHHNRTISCVTQGDLFGSSQQVPFAMVPVDNLAISQPVGSRRGSDFSIQRSDTQRTCFMAIDSRRKSAFLNQGVSLVTVLAPIRFAFSSVGFVQFSPANLIITSNDAFMVAPRLGMECQAACCDKKCCDNDSVHVVSPILRNSVYAATMRDVSNFTVAFRVPAIPAFGVSVVNQNSKTRYVVAGWSTGMLGQHKMCSLRRQT